MAEEGHQLMDTQHLPLIDILLYFRTMGHIEKFLFQLIAEEYFHVFT